MTQPFLHVRCDAPVGTLRLCIDERIHADWTVLFGPSGSGKSSLLRLLAGLWRPRDASVLLHGQDLTLLPPHRRSIAFVAQTPSLFPHLTVRGNVAFGARTPIDPLLETFGLASLAYAGIRTLSGGEAQRVSIARAIATEPHLLLLDESFTGMHRNLRRQLTVILRQIQQQRASAGSPLPILSVTHDVAETFACADDVLRIEDGHVLARGNATAVLAQERADLISGL